MTVIDTLFESEQYGFIVHTYTYNIIIHNFAKALTRNNTDISDITVHLTRKSDLQKKKNNIQRNVGINI